MQNLFLFGKYKFCGAYRKFYSFHNPYLKEIRLILIAYLRPIEITFESEVSTVARYSPGGMNRLLPMGASA